jgi:hypothetical protein
VAIDTCLSTYNCAYPSGSMQITGTGNTGWSSTWEGCDWP